MKDEAEMPNTFIACTGSCMWKTPRNDLKLPNKIRSRIAFRRLLDELVVRSLAPANLLYMHLAAPKHLSFFLVQFNFSGESPFRKFSRSYRYSMRHTCRQNLEVKFGGKPKGNLKLVKKIIFKNSDKIWLIGIYDGRVGKIRALSPRNFFMRCQHVRRVFSFYQKKVQEFEKCNKKGATQ